MRFGDFCSRRAMEAPDTPAAVFGEQRWTYRELDRHVEACARALIACGVARGDRVATLSTPRPEYAVTFLAAARIGAIWVGLNPVQQLDEYRYILGDTKPAVVLAFEQLRERDNREILQILKQEGAARRFVLFDGEQPGFLSYADFIAAGAGLPDTALASRAASVRADDPALIVYTSGSTGKPKGAVLTQRNIAHWAVMYAGLWQKRPLRVMCNLPVTHVGCCVETLAFALAAGGTLIFQEHFDAAGFLALVEREKVTWAPLVATMFQRILALPDWERFDTGSMQGVLFGGTALPIDMITKLKRLAGTITGTWGMTESTGGLTFTREGDSPEVLSQTVGRPEPTHEIRLMDGAGTILPPGSTGEVVLRGPCVFAGYFGMEEATREVIDAQGWLHSGDLGKFDEAGNLLIVGRIKDMFKSGGYNVYPREIELAIEAHGDVSLAAVVPVPDPTYQEVGYAFVIAEPGRRLDGEDILRHCRGRLANYKVPKQVFVRSQLPMLAVGKIDKTALRAEALSLAAATPNGRV